MYTYTLSKSKYRIPKCTSYSSHLSPFLKSCPPGKMGCKERKRQTEGPDYTHEECKQQCLKHKSLSFFLSSPLFVALLVRLAPAFLSHVLTDKSTEQTFDVVKQGKVVNLTRKKSSRCSMVQLLPVPFDAGGRAASTEKRESSKQRPRTANTPA